MEKMKTLNNILGFFQKVLKSLWNLKKNYNIENM